MTEISPYNLFTNLEERIKTTTNDILSNEDDKDIITVLTILLCQVEEVNRQITFVLDNNSAIVMKRVTSSVIGLGIGIVVNTVIMTTSVVTPTLPMIIGSIACVIPLSGAIGFYSAKQPIPELRLYEILEKTSLYKHYLKTLLRLIPRDAQHDYVKKVCEEIKTM